MRYVLGIEGGGTKTLLRAADLDGRGEREARVGGSSLSRRAEGEVAAELARGCALARGDWAAEDCAAVCAGFASAGRSSGFFEATLRHWLPQAHVQVMTDAELAWRAANGGGDGIAIIAGTGSIAWGGFQGRQARAGGQGPGHDPGSGDWIGREAVASGLAPAPEDGNFPALLPWLLKEHWEAMQPILRRAADELAALLRACAETLRWHDPIGYSFGGVFAAVPELRGWVEQAWGHPVQAPRQSALDAALDLARAAAEAAR